MGAPREGVPGGAGVCLVAESESSRIPTEASRKESPRRTIRSFWLLARMCCHRFGRLTFIVVQEEFRDREESVRTSKEQEQEQKKEQQQ